MSNKHFKDRMITENSLTEKYPIQLKSGEFACPDCKTPLAKNLVPYFEDGSFLGAFDGLLCPMCRYGLFSDKGYDDLGKALHDSGIIQKTSQLVNGDIVWSNHLETKSEINLFKNLSKFNEEKVKGESITDVEFTESIIKL